MYLFSKEDSSEPESSGKVDEEGLVVRGDKGPSSSFPPPRGVLKRMHNVVVSGDDKDKAGGAAVDPSIVVKSSLQASSSSSTGGGGGISAFKKSGLASAVKRVQMGRSPSIVKKKVEEATPPEIIGAGLPLIQRLRLLKQKEDREKKQQEEREALMKTLIPSNLSLASPNGSPTVSPIMHTRACVEAPPKTTDPATALAQVVERTRVERASISSVESGGGGGPGAISSPPSTSLPLLGTFSPKSNLLIGEAAAVAASKATAEPIPIASGGSFPTFPPVWTPSPPRGPSSSVSAEPVASSSSSCGGVPPPPTHPRPSSYHHHSASVSSADRRPSALQLRQQHAAKNYGSVDDLSPEFSRLPFIKKLKILNERQKIAELLLSKSANSVLTRSTSEGSNENPVVGSEVEVTLLHSVQMGRRTQSNRELLEVEGTGGDEEEGLSPRQYFSSKSSSPIKSPQTGSMSIAGGVEEDREENLGRSVTTTTTQKKKTLSEDSNATVCLKDGGGSNKNEEVRSNSSSAAAVAVVSGGVGHKSKVRKRRKVKKPEEGMTMMRSGGDSSPSPSPPLSPEGESNETPERRNLKSILKKLAETKEGEEEGVRDGEGSRRMRDDEVSLLKAPTVEGYAARHRKFAKNVTFRRQAVTVVSPEGPTTTTATSSSPSTTTTSSSCCLPSSSIISTSPISAPLNSDEAARLLLVQRDQPDLLAAILPLLQSLSSEVTIYCVHLFFHILL